MRLPILRETKATAVLVRLGDRESVESSEDLVIASIYSALEIWLSHPF